MAKVQKVTQQLYKSDRERLQEVIVMLTKHWGRQATMADAVKYLLDEEAKKKAEAK